MASSSYDCSIKKVVTPTQNIPFIDYLVAMFEDKTGWSKDDCEIHYYFDRFG